MSISAMKARELDLRKHGDSWPEVITEVMKKQNFRGQRFAIALSKLSDPEFEKEESEATVHLQACLRSLHKRVTPLGQCAELSISDPASCTDQAFFAPMTGLSSDTTEHTTVKQRSGLQCLTLQLQAIPDCCPFLCHLLSGEEPSLQKVAVHAKGITQVMLRNPQNGNWLDIGRVQKLISPPVDGFEYAKVERTGVQTMARWLLQNRLAKVMTTQIRNATEIEKVEVTSVQNMAHSLIESHLLAVGKEGALGYPVSSAPSAGQQLMDNSVCCATEHFEPPPPVAVFSHRRQRTDPGTMTAQYQQGRQSSANGTAAPQRPERLSVEVQNVVVESRRRGISVPPPGSPTCISPPSKMGGKSVSPQSKVGNARMPPRIPTGPVQVPVATIASPSRSNAIKGQPPQHCARSVSEAYGSTHEHHNGIETSPPPSQRHRDVSSGRVVQPQTLQQATPWMTPNSDLSVFTPARNTPCMNTPCPTPAFQQTFQQPFQSGAMLSGASKAVPGRLFVPGLMMPPPAAFHDSTLR